MAHQLSVVKTTLTPTPYTHLLFYLRAVPGSAKPPIKTLLLQAPSS